MSYTESAHEAFCARHRHGSAAGPATPISLEPTRSPRRQQISTLTRRHIRLIFADRPYFVYLTLLPFVLGALSLVVPGDGGFGPADIRGRTPNEPAQIVMLLNVNAVFMGAALTVRDLVGERPIFCREQAVGLAASAYLTAKVAVFLAVISAQTAVLTAIVVAGKGAPRLARCCWRRSSCGT